MGSNILWVPLISACLMSRGTDYFVSDYLLKDTYMCLYSRQLWAIEIVSPSGGGAGSLNDIIKDWNSWALGSSPITL